MFSGGCGYLGRLFSTYLRVIALLRPEHSLKLRLRAENDLSCVAYARRHRSRLGIACALRIAQPAVAIAATTINFGSRRNTEQRGSRS